MDTEQPPATPQQAVQQAIAIAFHPAPATAVAVTKSPIQRLREAGRARRQRTKLRLQDRLAEAKMYEKLGSKVLRIGVKGAHAIGDRASGMGIKVLGHGRIVISGENAQQAIDECDNMIAELKSAEPPIDTDRIITLMELKLSFNAQLMATGKAHIDADKQAVMAPQDNRPGIPFPPGGSMTIMVESPPAQQQQISQPPALIAPPITPP